MNHKNENKNKNKNETLNPNPKKQKTKPSSSLLRQFVSTDTDTTNNHNHNNNNNLWEIGIDEVGRGPLFGRVYVAGVIIRDPTATATTEENNNEFKYEWMKDSKKFTSERKIQEVAAHIREKAAAYVVHYAEAAVIDQLNILGATLSLMRACALDLIAIILEKDPTVDVAKDVLILVDGNHFPILSIFDEKAQESKVVHHETVTQGDNTYCSIAAASILAKVSRDAYIAELCDTDPSLDEKYGLRKNKGYGTSKHVAGLREYGPTAEHRRSFKVKGLSEETPPEETPPEETPPEETPPEETPPKETPPEETPPEETPPEETPPKETPPEETPPEETPPEETPPEETPPEETPPEETPPEKEIIALKNLKIGDFITFFDLETTGLPLRGYETEGAYKDKKKFNSSRIVQIACMLCKVVKSPEVPSGVSIEEQMRINQIFKCVDFSISPQNAEIHGITQDRSVKEGKPFKDTFPRDIYGTFFGDSVAMVLAHNAKFDTNILKSECYRYGFTHIADAKIHQKKVTCTMEATKHLIQAKNARGDLKSPNLKELYAYAMGIRNSNNNNGNPTPDMQQHHNALYDVLNMVEAVKILLENNLLVL